MKRGGIALLKVLILFLNIGLVNAAVFFVNPTLQNGSLSNTSIVSINISTNFSDRSAIFFESVSGEIMGAYSFENRSGSSILPIAGSNLTAAGTIVTGISGFNTSLILNGTNYFTAPNASFVVGTSDFSVSVKVKINTNLTLSSDIHSIATTSAGGAGNGWVLFLRGSSTYNGLQFKFVNGSTTYSFSPTTDLQPILNDNKWHNITLSIDRSGYWILYVDNSEFYKKFYNASLGVNISNSQDLWIGRSPVGYSNMEIDNLLIIGRALRFNEINALDSSSIDSLSTNFYAEENKTYNFKAYSLNSNGTQDISDIRSIQVNNTDGIKNPYDSSLSIGYPISYTTFQRFNATHGKIIIKGSYTGTPNYIQARFNSGNWFTVNNSLSGGIFSGEFDGLVGQGGLEIIGDDVTSTKKTISNVSIGDLYLLLGQSNMAGGGWSYSNYSRSLGFDIFAYHHGAWQPADDPTAGIRASPWPTMFSNLVREEGIPINFLNLAISGTKIIEWTENYTGTNCSASNYRCWDYLRGNIMNATNGTNYIKGVLWFQGESDALESTISANGSTELYKERFLEFKSSLKRLVNISSDKIILGQTGPYYYSSGSYTGLGGIRLAQQQLWEDNEDILQGPITFDINLSNSSDESHFATFDDLNTLGNRWLTSINVLYGSSQTQYPNLTYLYYSGNVIVLELDQSNLKIESVFNITSDYAYGFRINNSGTTYLNSEGIESTSINGNYVILKSKVDLNSSSRLWFGANADAMGKPTIRSVTSNLPLTPFNNVLMAKNDKVVCIAQGTYWYSESCHSTPEIISIGRDYRTFMATQEQINQGYEVILQKNWRLQFYFGNESHILILDNIINNTATITLSSKQIILNLTINETKKINLNEDNYYELQIFLKNISIYSANLVVKKIDEEIVTEKTEKETEKSDFWIGIMIISLLIIFLICKLKRNNKKKNFRK